MGNLILNRESTHTQKRTAIDPTDIKIPIKRNLNFNSTIQNHSTPFRKKYELYRNLFRYVK